MTTTTTSTSTTTSTTTTIDLGYRHFSETVDLVQGMNKITVIDEAGFSDSIYVVRK